MKALILDTETTGHDEAPECIELAYASAKAPGGYIGMEEVFRFRFKPSKPILLEALAVHHILPEELEDCPPSSAAKVPEGCEYLIGHNIDYDWKVLGSPEGVKRICTLAIARAAFPTLTSHNVGVLAYLFAEDKARARDKLKDRHSAGVDVFLTACILSNLILHYTRKGMQFFDWEQLWLFSEECRVPKVWAFGKYRGQPVRGTDPGYLRWCLRQPDMDPYVKIACEKELTR